MRLSEELFFVLEAAYKVPSPGDVSQKYFGGDESPGVALERFLVGVGLAIAQNWMAVDKRYGSKEVKDYLKVRRQYHPLFVGAAAVLANELEDTRVKAAVPLLRKVSGVPVGQEQKLVELGARAVARMRGLRVDDVEDPRVRKSLMPLYRASVVFRAMGGEGEGEPDYHAMKSNSEEFFEYAVKFRSIPPKIKTLFRKMLKQPGMVQSTFVSVARTGTWEMLPPEEKERVQKQAVVIREKEEAAYQIEDPEERSREYRRLAKERSQLQNDVGVNIGVIEQGETESVDEALKQERKQERDALAEYVISKFFGQTMEMVRKYPKQHSAGKREIGKVLTRLGKAKTLATGRLVIQEAVQRGVLGSDDLESYDSLVQLTEGNLAVQEGVAIAPLDWAPVDEETFRERHDVGEVRFGEGYTEKEKKEVLGRVSRALADLETVYGSKVAGRHVRKLKMEFEGGIGVSGGAAASYFGWDDRNRWQPRVRFGHDFDNLLAHELSHYFDDLIAFEIDRKASGGDWKEYRYGDVAHGPGDIFGTTGVKLGSAAEFFEAPPEGSWQAKVTQEVPELVEWVRAVDGSPDHERWQDLVPGAYDMVIVKAAKDVLGDDLSWEEQDRIQNIGRKSELPPGVAERAEELYREMMEGDTRGLAYNHSVVEVWARMCEQYVYTKLSRDGIANPWLTRMSYDTRAGGTNEKFMDQGRFDEVMVPIYDRLFARLRKKGMIGEGVVFISWGRLLQEALC